MPEVYSSLQKIRIILEDSRMLARVCGVGVAAKWLAKVAVNAKTCVRSGSLQAADFGVGEGPFDVKLRHARAKLVGEGCMCGIRELWVRDVYLHNGWLSIPEGGTVLDLGANMGNFTMLALAQAPNVRAVAVEANAPAIAAIERQAKLNGWQDQLQCINCFVGGTTFYQEDLDKELGGKVPHLNEEQLIERGRLTHIDFLKCDIEGSEFDLLKRDSRLLAMSDQIAIELHDRAGDREPFMQMLRDLGFEVTISRAASQDVIVLARRRAAQQVQHAGASASSASN